MNKQQQRRVASTVAMLWMATWLLGVLHPCCESVAAFIPHDHPTVDTHADEHHHHGSDHHSGSKPATQQPGVHSSVPVHKHCGAVGRALTDFYALLSDFEVFEALPDVQDEALHDIVARIASRTSSTISFLSRGPPFPKKPIYLETQRLRI